MNTQVFYIYKLTIMQVVASLRLEKDKLEKKTNIQTSLIEKLRESEKEAEAKQASYESEISTLRAAIENLESADRSSDESEVA
jgi:hypothetical protein